MNDDDYEPFDEDVAPECPATFGEHFLTEMSGYPFNYAGQCRIYVVCEECGETVSEVEGKYDSVL